MAKSDLEDMFEWQIIAKRKCNPAVARAEREVMFHPTRKWRWDFSWTDKRVALEIEGGGFVGGRHVRGTGLESGCEKHSEAAARGWLVIRATGRQVESGQALAWVERALQLR